MEILLARSPLLKSLSLLMLLFPAKNGVYHQWVIQAPNLQNFFITGLYDDGWQIGDLTFLEEATVDWPLYSYDRDFVKLITGLSQARELDFAMPVKLFYSTCFFTCTLSAYREVIFLERRPEGLASIESSIGNRVNMGDAHFTYRSTQKQNNIQF